MLISIETLRDHTHPINRSFNKIVEEIKNHTTDEQDFQKLLTEKIVNDFISFSSHKRKSELPESTIFKKKKMFNQPKIPNSLKKREKLKKKKKSCSKNPAGSLGLSTPPDMPLPSEFKDRIQEKEGRDIKLIIQKTLFNSDLNRHHNRLSIPERQLRDRTFLTQQDIVLLEKVTIDENGKKKRKGLAGALLIEPSMEESRIDFRQWNMNSKCYVLCSSWYSVAVRNKLKEGDCMQLWSFRALQPDESKEGQGKLIEKLCFAMVKIRDDNGHGSGASTSNTITSSYMDDID